MSWTVSSLAYLKIILHSAKYPTSAVSGLLLGSMEGSESLVVQDAVPLLHHWTGLSPATEIALQLTEHYASSRNLTILGLYHAPASVSDAGPAVLPPTLVPLANQIKARSPKGSLVLILDATLVPISENALVPFLPSSAHSAQSPWSLSSFPLKLSSSSIPATALARAQVRSERDALADWDDHLEDASKDWLENKTITV